MLSFVVIPVVVQPRRKGAPFWAPIIEWRNDPFRVTAQGILCFRTVLTVAA
jgi:hypothetical protein